MPRHSEPFETFVAPARARPELWRLALGLVVIFGIYGGLGAGLFALARWLTGGFDFGAAADARDALAFLSTFAGMALGVWLAAGVLQDRTGASLFGPVAWRDFRRAAFVSAGVFAAAFGGWLMWFTPVPNLGLGAWAALLPLGLVLLLVQTGAEELVFRGYLQSQLAARFRSPLVWALGPSVLFAMAHYDATLPPQMRWGLLVATGIFGVLAADLTARTGGIWAAWGLHFSNNAMALLVVAAPGPVSGLALFETPYTAAEPIAAQMLVLDVLVLVLAWAVLRWPLAR